jgi:uncharacterized membrane protein
MSVLGSLHVAAAVLALVVAAIVLVRNKGTTSHVRLGRIYVVLLVLVDAFALLTYQNGSALSIFSPSSAWPRSLRVLCGRRAGEAPGKSTGS